MPFYEYECRNCKYYLEVLQKITEAPLTKCPSCGRKTLVKLISAPVFRLKGGGWYETDFKSDKEDKRNLASTEREQTQPAASTESESSSSTKTEPRASERTDTAARESTGARAGTDPKTPAQRATAAGDRPSKSSGTASSPMAARSAGKPRAAPTPRRITGSGPRPGIRARGKPGQAKRAAPRRSER